MAEEQEADVYLDDLAKKLAGMSDAILLGEEMQQGIRLSQTNRGARTNARIEAAQKHEGFDETGIAEDELNDVDDDITNELLTRALEELFGE